MLLLLLWCFKVQELLPQIYLTNSTLYHVLFTVSLVYSFLIDTPVALEESETRIQRLFLILMGVMTVDSVRITDYDPVHYR